MIIGCYFPRCRQRGFIQNGQLPDTPNSGRRLAEKAKALGRRALEEVATLARPETFVGLASQVDRSEVRPEQEAGTRTSASYG